METSPHQIRLIGYDPDEELLQVQYADRRCYEYEGVPEYLYKGLLEAERKLQYLKDHVWRAGYESRRIA